MDNARGRRINHSQESRRRSSLQIVLYPRRAGDDATAVGTRVLGSHPWVGPTIRELCGSGLRVRLRLGFLVHGLETRVAATRRWSSQATDSNSMVCIHVGPSHRISCPPPARLNGNAHYTRALGSVRRYACAHFERTARVFPIRRHWTCARSPIAARAPRRGMPRTSTEVSDAQACGSAPYTCSQVTQVPRPARARAAMASTGSELALAVTGTMCRRE